MLNQRVYQEKLSRFHFESGEEVTKRILKNIINDLQKQLDSCEKTHIMDLNYLVEANYMLKRIV